MTVYVDDARIRATAGRVSGRWSHLFSWPWDDPAELHGLARRIGLSRSWYQDKVWPHGHYDVTDPLRRQAIAAGTVPVSWRDTGRLMSAARARGRGNPPPDGESARWSPPPLAASGAVLALTLRQPWAWAILHAAKTTENRSWVLPQGPLWLHAGSRARWDPAGAAHPLVQAAWRHLHGDAPLNRHTNLMPFKAVTALVRIGPSHSSGDCAGAGGQVLFPGREILCDGWAASGQVHHQVAVTAPLPGPVECDGRQGLWPLPQDAEEAAWGQLGPDARRLAFPGGKPARPGPVSQ